MNEEINSQRLFSTLLEEVWSESGGRDNLASAIGVDPSLLTRFKNDENGLKISFLNKLFSVAGVVAMTRSREEQMKDMICGMARMLEEERKRNTKIGKPCSCATN